MKKKLNTITKNLNTNEIVIVDIGCGDTFVLESISEDFKFKNFYGVDTAFESEDINDIEKKYNGKIKLFNDVNDLKLNEKDVHIVLLMDVIEHIE
ncbi:MAG: methyltransferase domain-containing protein, partial [Bacteroidota bacterium]